MIIKESIFLIRIKPNKDKENTFVSKSKWQRRDVNESVCSH